MQGIWRRMISWASAGGIVEEDIRETRRDSQPTRRSPAPGPGRPRGWVGARESVLVAGYAVYQGHVVSKALAERMDQSQQLDAKMFLDIQRRPHDHSGASELVRRFAERFVRREWPGVRFPELFYDPRSLEIESTKRASLHAKCVVVDRELAFVSSANFTEAAHTKNVEVGVRLRSPALARRLAAHFEILVEARVLKPIPPG